MLRQTIALTTALNVKRVRVTVMNYLEVVNVTARTATVPGNDTKKPCRLRLIA